MFSTIKVACFIVALCFEVKDWTALKDSLMHIAKRRGQLKEVGFCFQHEMKKPNVSIIYLR